MVLVFFLMCVFVLMCVLMLYFYSWIPDQGVFLFCFLFFVCVCFFPLKTVNFIYVLGGGGSRAVLFLCYHYGGLEHKLWNRGPLFEFFHYHLLASFLCASVPLCQAGTIPSPPRAVVNTKHMFLFLLLLLTTQIWSLALRYNTY